MSDHHQHVASETEHEVRNSINFKKRRGGRPPLIPAERRRFKIKIGFTTSEFEKLADRAETANVSEPEFIRRICLNQQIYAIPKINAQALTELNRIGNNINQLARRANELNIIPTPRQLDQITHELNQIGKQIASLQ